VSEKDLGKTSLNMEPNIAGLLCYLAGFVTGLIFILLEKDNKFIRFHAMQSLIVSGAFFVLRIVDTAFFYLFVPWPVRLAFNGILGLVALVFWIVLMVKAYQGEYFKLPIAGDIAEKHANI